jgi:hypothetical protein
MLADLGSMGDNTKAWCLKKCAEFRVGDADLSRQHGLVSDYT